MKKTLATLSVLTVLFAGVMTTSISAYAKSEEFTELTEKADLKKGNELVLNVEKLKNSDINAILHYLESEGNHVILKGISLKDQEKFVSKLYKRGDGKFRFDLNSFQAVDDEQQERNDQLAIPTYLSIANVDGEIKLTYGVSYVTFASKKEAREFEKRLKDKNFEPRKLLMDQADAEIEEMLAGNYTDERSEFLHDKKKEKMSGKLRLAAGDIIWDDIRVNQTFYFGNWTSGLPTAGKIDGYWLVCKHNDNNSSYDYFTIEGDFTIFDGARAGGSVANKLESYKGGVYLTSNIDEMIKGAPITDTLELNGSTGTSVSFSLGVEGPSISVSFEWPASGYNATLEAEVTRGSKGYYHFIVYEDNRYNWLPGRFTINYATHLKSHGTFFTADLTQRIRTNSSAYKNDYFKSEVRLRNDY